ncbi:MAG: hypothetical protein QOF76_3484, partial [Solirubrobacteraceae bacterium]|nr:hypothetical protein [Solirubrobacteraceae bacterium]
MAVDTTVNVEMPAMGDSVTEGTILEWLKKEGDSVSADDPLVEVSTDKVDAEVPSPASGVITKILAQEGDTVTIGQVLCEISQGDGNGSGNGSAPAAEAETDEPATEEKIIDIEIPTMGDSITEGTILEWLKKVGDSVEEDEGIVEVSTDKVDAELPSPAAGVITETLAEEGDTVTVGQVVARMKVGGAGAPAKTSSDGAAAPAETPKDASGNGAAAATPDGVKATPVAKRVAAVEGVDLAKVTGTGPGGRITKEDVLNGESEPAVDAKPIKGAAAMLARYMDESRQIPTATSFRTITVTTLDGRRKQLKEAGHKVSFTHLIAYAIAMAATDQMPVMARHFLEQGGKPHFIDDGRVNLGIAVDVEKKDGSRTLMVPVIRDAGRLSFQGFLDAFGDLIARARENKLTADDLQGANISLTNPGGIGTIASVPRLMTGQGTIVATGSIAYPVGLGNIGAQIGAEKVMTMTSTYDHRIIQGAESGQFLQVVEGYLQGEHGFYEQIFGELGIELGPAPAPPAPTLA